MHGATGNVSRTLRAAVFEEVGRPLAIETLEIAEPGPGEVLVRLAASGVCHSDYHVVVGDWTVPTPLVLGHEGAGVVEAIGPGVRTVATGDHVVLSWSPSCGRCRYCVAGRPNLCELAERTTYASVSFDGSTRLSRSGQAVHSYCTVGSFGELTVVPETGAIPVAKEAPLELAALVGCGVTTGIGAAVNTARVRPGASVLVIGCGGVGLAVVQGAALCGAEPLIAADPMPHKRALAERLGATHTIDPTDGDVLAAIHEITGHPGVDYAFEAIGLAATVEQAIDATAPGGTAVIVGQTAEGVRATFDPFALSDREKTVKGCNYGSSRPAIDFPRIVDLHLAGRIDLGAFVTDTIGLDEVNQAMDAIGRREAVRNVIVY